MGTASKVRKDEGARLSESGLPTASASRPATLNSAGRSHSRRALRILGMALAATWKALLADLGLRRFH
jgi:hypothetical protein